MNSNETKAPFVLEPSIEGTQLTLNRADYYAAVETRWSGFALRDAKVNWTLFRQYQPDLEAWVRHYLKDNWFKVGDKCHNQSGTLSGMLWLAGNTHQWLIDLEEYFQTFFLRRGSVQFCKMLCAHLEQP